MVTFSTKVSESVTKGIFPKDTLNLVFIIFLFNGIATLFPWNMLINADHYFTNYKLNVTNPSTAVNDYRHHFLSYLGIASKAPNIVLQILNMFINAENANLSRRISITLVMQIVVFIFIIGCAAVDSTSWPGLFFWITMGSAAFINTANGVYQGCVYGLAARFPMKYTNAITIGMSVSGTIASLLTILSIAISPNEKVEAIVFFSFAVVQLSACWIAEFFLVKNKYYQHYAHDQRRHLQVNHDDDLFYRDESAKISEIEHKMDQQLSFTKKYLFVFKKIWIQLLNIIVIYSVSLSLYPAVTARIDSTDNLLGARYFTPVFCFLFFSFFGTVGNFTAQYIQWPGPNWLIVPCLARLAFVPFFLFCNYLPGESWVRTVNVFFVHDWMFIVGIVAMAWSSGYLSSLAMMYIPRLVPSRLSATAGMLGAVTIILGILVGINTGLLYPKMVSKQL